MPPINLPASEVNKALVARRFARARQTYNREARVQRRVTEQTMRLLLDALRRLGIPPEATSTHFRHIVELGCGPGTLSRQLVQTFRPLSLLLNDLCPEMEDCLQDLLGMDEGEPPSTVTFMPGDAETLPLPRGTDLIISCSTLQWFASPGAFFRRCRAALEPGGLLVVSTFGPDNLRETRALTGGGLAYRSLDDLRHLLAPHFRLLYSGEERITLSFDSPADVLRHLKLTGATGTGITVTGATGTGITGTGIAGTAATGIAATGITATEPLPWTPGRLRAFCHDYASRFGSPDGHGVGLTYHPIYLLARKDNTYLL